MNSSSHRLSRASSLQESSGDMKSAAVHSSLLLLLFVGSSLQQKPELSEQFFRCICMVESNCNRNIGCIPDPDVLSCGPYQIQEAFWIDASQFAGKNLGGSWKECTTGSNNEACSREAMKNYFARYGRYCTGGSTPTLQDYARIHNGGPNGCKQQYTLGYWNKVRSCLGQ